MRTMSGVGRSAGAPGRDEAARRPRPGGRPAGRRRPGRRRPGRHVARGRSALVVVMVVAGVLLVAGLRKNSQIDSLQGERRARCELTVTRCLALIGGTGSSPAGFECTGTYGYRGRHYTEGVPGSREPAGRIDRPRHRGRPDDPGLFSTPVDGGRPSTRRPPGCVLPAGRVRGGGSAPCVWVVVRRRRRGRRGADRSRADVESRSVAPRYRGAWPPTRTSPRSRSGSPAPSSRRTPGRATGGRGPRDGRGARGGRRPRRRQGAADRPGRRPAGRRSSAILVAEQPRREGGQAHLVGGQHAWSLVLFGLAFVMLASAWFRKRLYLGIACALYGLSIFNLHYWGFGVPFLLIGSWYLVRAYRLRQKLKLAKARTGRPGPAARPGGPSPTSATPRRSPGRPSRRRHRSRGTDT